MKGDPVSRKPKKDKEKKIFDQRRSLELPIKEIHSGPNKILQTRPTAGRV